MNAETLRPTKDTSGEDTSGAKVSWTPMIVIAMAQIMMIFNISTLQVSIDGVASSFNTSATTVGTAIVVIWRSLAAILGIAGGQIQRHLWRSGLE